MSKVRTVIPILQMHRLRLEGDLGLAQSLKLRCRATTETQILLSPVLCFLKEKPPVTSCIPLAVHMWHLKIVQGAEKPVKTDMKQHLVIAPGEFCPKLTSTNIWAYFDTYIDINVLF